MAASGPKPGILRERQFQIQIGDTPRRSESLVTHGLQRFTPQFNRTAVMFEKIQLDKLVFDAVSHFPDDHADNQMILL
jgi:hypothetical protein